RRRKKRRNPANLWLFMQRQESPIVAFICCIVPELSEFPILIIGIKDENWPSLSAYFGIIPDIPFQLLQRSVRFSMFGSSCYDRNKTLYRFCHFILLLLSGLKFHLSSYSLRSCSHLPWP